MCMCEDGRGERQTMVDSVTVRAVDIRIVVEMMSFWGGRNPFPWKYWLCAVTLNPCRQVMHPANPFWCETVFGLAIKSNVVRM